MYDKHWPDFVLEKETGFIEQRMNSSTGMADARRRAAAGDRFSDDLLEDPFKRWSNSTAMQGS